MIQALMKQPPLSVPVEPLLQVRDLSLLYGPEKGCQGVSFDLYPGEVLGLSASRARANPPCSRCSAVACRPRPATLAIAARTANGWTCTAPAKPSAAPAAHRMGLCRAEPTGRLAHGRLGRRQRGERLMAQGVRNYQQLRGAGLDWLSQVEIDPQRIDDLPRTFSGGMQQRLQIARNLVSSPRLVFMDEPTGGLDVSVQARLLDLLRGLVRELDLAVVIVTHDLAVARLLADRLMVMRRSRVVETGLTDQILDDPQHPYSQLLVSSVLQP